MLRNGDAAQVYGRAGSGLQVRGHEAGIVRIAGETGEGFRGGVVWRENEAESIHRGNVLNLHNSFKAGF